MGPQKSWEKKLATYIIDWRTVIKCETLSSFSQRFSQLGEEEEEEEEMVALAAIRVFSSSRPQSSWRYDLFLPSVSPKNDRLAKQVMQFPIPTLYQNQSHLSHSTVLYATLNKPKGFGPSKKKRTEKTKKPKTSDNDNEDSDDEDEEDDMGMEEADAGVIPEVVTNRMMSRMGFSVGIPLFVGLLFFPMFYYLKVGLKIDVPTWVPFLVSFFFFGTALLGVSYGIVSSSWDPLREGSLLGWTEAQKNWPVFWQSLRGRPTKK